jgi:hypothetical protein
MATLEQRITALEEKRGQVKKQIDPQFQADVLTASQYFHANGESFDMLPPDHFTEGERRGLELVIWAQQSC